MQKQGINVFFLRRPVKLKEDCALWVLALIIFLSTNSVYFHLLPTIIVHAIKLSALLLPLVIKALLHRLTIEGKNTIVKLLALGFFVFLLLPKAMISGNTFEFIGIFALHTLLMLLNIATLREHGILDLFDKYERITVTFAIISLFFWFFGEICHVIPNTGYVTTEWSGTVANYFFLHFGAQSTRNCGVFVEAPMYNLALCTAIFFELFAKSQVNKFRLSVLIITNLTTLSTTGQLLLMAALAFRFLALKKRKLSIFKLTIFSLVAVVVAGAAIYASKVILVEKADGASFVVRAQYMLKELHAFTTSPIVGHGFYSFSAGTSNSICLIMAEGGIIQLIIYTSCLVVLPIIVSKRSKDPRKKYFHLFFFLAFCITVSPYLLLTYAMMAVCASSLLVSDNFYIKQYAED